MRHWASSARATATIPIWRNPNEKAVEESWQPKPFRVWTTRRAANMLLLALNREDMGVELVEDEEFRGVNIREISIYVGKKP